jgi:arylsulfatase
MKSLWSFLFMLGIVLAPTTGLSATASGSKPNIILIMSDDMGYSDLGCYGSEIDTPTLDGLAANGLRFTQFYNTSRCCPTRASLLTGLYQHQAGIGHMMNDRRKPGYRGDLAKNCVTIAEVLKPAGYRCYMAGKWHVTKKIKPRRQAEKHNWPLQRGFDRFYGTIHGAGSLWDPNSLTRDNQLISPYADPEYKPDEPWFYTDAISDHAVRYIREHEGDNPFFMYIAYTAAHWPMHARERDIKKYKGKYDQGYTPIRKARYERMKKLGVIDDHWKLSRQHGNWEKTRNKAWHIRNMEVYAAMIDGMDQGIGRIVAELKKQKKLDNTLILFLQDNGGCHETFGWRGKGGKRADTPPLKPMKPAALQYRMLPLQTRDGYPVRTGVGVMAGPADTYVGYGQAWANVSNTPFREYKSRVHEGGISTPLIVHWPARIKDRGKLRHAPSHLIDVMATCVDISGATYPTRSRDTDVTPMEGRSLVPVFDGKELPERALFFEHEDNCAVRLGKWKLVARKILRGNSIQAKRWELYDMQADRSEVNNLAGKMPEKVKELHDLYVENAKRLQILPKR